MIKSINFIKIIESLISQVGKATVIILYKYGQSYT